MRRRARRWPPKRCCGPVVATKSSLHTLVSSIRRVAQPVDHHRRSCSLSHLCASSGPIDGVRQAARVPPPPLDPATRLRLMAAGLTYGADVRADMEPADGCWRLERSRRLGIGDAVFDAVRDCVFSWDMHVRAGFHVRTSGPQILVGSTLTLETRIGPAEVLAPCRVIRVTRDDNRFGFAYGCLRRCLPRLQRTGRAEGRRGPPGAGLHAPIATGERQDRERVGGAWLRTPSLNWARTPKTPTYGRIVRDADPASCAGACDRRAPWSRKHPVRAGLGTNRPACCAGA